MPMDHKLPKDHIGLTERCWQNIQRGIIRCLDSEEDRHKCIKFCEKCMAHGQHNRGTWKDILEGKYPERVAQILNTGNFFDLPQEQINFWENHVQNHPFVAIFAREEYQKLLEKRSRMNYRPLCFIVDGSS